MWPAPTGKGVARKGFTGLEVRLEGGTAGSDIRGQGQGQAEMAVNTGEYCTPPLHRGGHRSSERLNSSPRSHSWTNAEED